MNEKYLHSIWNHINAAAAILLSLLILFLILFSAFQNANGYTLAVSDKDKQSSIREKEQQLKTLESDFRKKNDDLNQLESQIAALEASLNKTKEQHGKIIQELVDQFSVSNQVLSIDSQTGAIAFYNGILFETSRDMITEAGANYLKEFIPAWISILLNEENRDYIAEIIIEGHGDDTGSYLPNLNLSQSRALEVTRYILSDEMPYFRYKDIVPSYISVNGRSFSQPIIVDGIIDKELSRRVEFKFRFRDERANKEIQKVIEEGIDS